MPQVTVSISDEGTPLHKFIRQHPTFKHLVPSRSQAHLAFKQNQIVVNGSGNPPEGLRLKEGDIVFLDRQEAQPIQTKQISLVVSYRMDPWIVLWKASGLSMDGRSDVFANCVRALLNLTKDVPVVAVFSLDKAVSGLVVVRVGYPVEGEKELKVEDFESVYRCIVMGKVGSKEGLGEGDEYAIENDVQGTACTTRFHIVSFTGSRNSPDGYMTTLNATPIEGFAQKQVLSHLFTSESPVIGNSRLTIQHRTCRDKGIFLSLISLSFTNPTNGERVVVTHDEPSKFQALRAKEAKFFDRKMGEIEEAVQAASAAHDDEDEDGGNEASAAGAQMKNPAYIRGITEFRGLTFKVTPAVMIPRLSSSILVDSAISHFLESPIPPQINILDMGTGSGSLLISTIKALELKVDVPVYGTALDASPDALRIAQQNIEFHGLKERVSTRLGRFGNVSTLFPDHAPVHILLCNPPYLSPKKGTVVKIDASLLNEEPGMALYSGPTGLEAYQEIAEGIQEADNSGDGFVIGCVLVVEIGHGMSNRVRQVFETRFVRGEQEEEGKRWSFKGLGRDHKGLERCLIFRKSE